MADLDTTTRFETLRSCRLLDYPHITKFGRNPHAYDLGGEDGQGADDGSDDYGDGAPGIELMGRCLATFARCWGRFDIQIAASVFNADAGLLLTVAPDADECAETLAGDDLGVLVQLVSMRKVDTTIAEVAALLNLPEQMVAQAVERHPWMYAGGERDGSPIIEHDGE